MIIARFAVFSLLFFASLPASAQVQTPMMAHQLQQLCMSRYDVDAGLCAGYVTAVADKLMRESNPANAVCMSPAISPQTLVDNLLRDWQEAEIAPEQMAFEAVEGVFRQRFRCP
jgi:hypothetical protein